VIRHKEHNEGLRWLGFACATIFVMDVLFLGVFQNDSYIHQYIGFYLVAPISIMAGVALDRVIAWAGNLFATRRAHTVASCVTCLLLTAVAFEGERQAKALTWQFRILDYKCQEPANLIPELGEVIRGNFSPGTQVLCNFLPDYGPQLEYYSHRELLNNLSDYGSWRRYLQDSTRRIAGVVWMGAATGKDILTKLPSGTKQFVKLGGISFCLWKPASKR
jgi:hypothetical protein